MKTENSKNSPAGTYSRLIGGVVLLVILAGIVLPARVVIEREIIIDAHRATVFALLNDFQQMEQWSPKAADDPNARLDFSGPPRGVGASISWDGRIAGQGRQTITESTPFERVATAIILRDGTEAVSIFTLADNDAGTSVFWSFERDFGFNIAGRYFGLLLNNIVGSDQEEDLVRLDDLARRLPRADFSELEVEQIVVEAVDIAYLRTTSIPEATAISEAMGDAYFEVLSFIDRHGLDEAGAPLSITRTFSGSELVFDAAIPVRGLSDATPRSEKAVRIGTTYEGPVIRVKHIGPYGTLGQTHDKIAAYLAATGVDRNGDVWESYISDPTRTDASNLLTYVYYPIRN